MLNLVPILLELLCKKKLVDTNKITLLLNLRCNNLYNGLHHPLDAVTNPEYMLMHFLTNTNKFLHF